MASIDPPARVLAIAGSDSGGGAGIQADLKAFAACGVHGMTAITAITAQSTTGVRSVHAVPPAMIVDQVEAVAEDIGVDAVKVGMLGTAETIEAVGAALALLPDAPVVLDPVMVAESGAVLLDESAREALRSRLLPLATVATPNLAEARVLAGADPPRSEPEPSHHEAAGSSGPEGETQDGEMQEVETLARRVRGLGVRIVVVTGGHRHEASDVFFDGGVPVQIAGERHPGGAAHGSGCTHSSVLAAQLARGAAPLEAARMARRLAGRAVRDGLGGIGTGAGPVDILGILERPGAPSPEADPPL